VYLHPVMSLIGFSFQIYKPSVFLSNRCKTMNPAASVRRAILPGYRFFILKRAYMKTIVLLVTAIASLPLLAQDLAVETPPSAEEVLTVLEARSGTITLPGAIATLQLPGDFVYLAPEKAELLLVDGWGNPPGNETLGMVLPAGINPLEAAGWGVVVTYDEDGYISDAEADDIDYDAMLADMKESSITESEERENQGYGPMLLVGWAEPPRYDKTTHKYFWAQEFDTNSDINSLNYNIRVLGRQGVLNLNAVAGMNQIDTVRTEMPALLAVTDFTPGNRYEEFDADTDRVAEYGLAALVAGGIAAKMGLFAKIGVFLLAFKKIAFVAVAALIGWFNKFRGGRNNSKSDP
jgi:uncharacterized membrane-anchored protein